MIYQVKHIETGHFLDRLGKWNDMPIEIVGIKDLSHSLSQLVAKEEISVVSNIEIEITTFPNPTFDYSPKS